MSCLAQLTIHCGSDRSFMQIIERLDPLRQGKIRELSNSISLPPPSLVTASPPKRAGAPSFAAPAQPTHAVQHPPAPAFPPRPPQAASGFGTHNSSALAPVAAAPRQRLGPALVQPARSGFAAPAPASHLAAPAPVPVARNIPPVAPGPLSEEDLAKRLMPSEEVQQKVAQIIPADVVGPLADADWKLRLEAMEKLVQFVADKRDSAESEVIARMLLECPGTKETNFQVVVRICDVLGALASIQGPNRLGKAPIQLWIAFLCEKLADIKARNPAGSALNAFCEVAAPSFVFATAFPFAEAHKNPKVLSEFLLWVAGVISDFGAAPVGVQATIEFLKRCFENTNPLVKSAATKAVVQLRLFVGPSLREFLADVKPTLLASIDKELAKVEGIPAPATTRTVRGDPLEKGELQRAAVQPGPSGFGVAQQLSSAAVPLSDDPPPSVDISASIAQYVTLLSSPEWKDRQDALAGIDATISAAGKQIAPSLGGLIPALKLRINDSIKQLAVMALSTLALVGEALGPTGVHVHLKSVAGSILAAFGDINPKAHAAAVACFDAWAAHTTVDVLLPFLVSSLSDVPGARRDALAWLSARAQNLPSEPETVSVLIKPLLMCLEDRVAEVRQFAEVVMLAVIARTGAESVRRQTFGMKPASLLAIKPLFDKAQAAAQPAAGVINQPRVPMQHSPTRSSGSQTALGAPRRFGDAAGSFGRPAAFGRSTSAPAETSHSESHANSMSDVPASTVAPSIPPPIQSSRQKDVRARKGFAALSASMVDADQLHQQLMPYVSPGLAQKMFSHDFKHHAEAIAELQQCINLHFDAVGIYLIFS
eukprot:TRINITY_DN5491_c0_g1_i3.p1 TRINITY_DN5491_c0_g1~~TRINITY_DN5491_c0_g1_i3.p1  ORF type:complete len:824 (-),score=185.54 TRINITY_DN5491_c0_g1_i3:1757-4228(-)